MEMDAVMEQLLQRIGEFMEGFTNFSLSLDFGTGAMSVAAYIFMALGLYSIAQKRQIKNPWLAWIPIANLWLLGCISDQYRYVTKGEESNRRGKLLSLAIMEAALVPVILVVAICLMVVVMAVTVAALKAADAFAVVLLVMLVLFILAMGIGAVVLSVLLQIQRCFAFYDLFCSCDPKNKTLYATLSIVASCLGIDLVAAIFIFICRNREDGMPARIDP